ncbi:mRNA-binding ribosome biosynthesis protein [Saccharomycopsis crataegensis]|uniref:mRNA-binding ribosome biosynthesis protein n=1 Tax=Saccharomycopsis crataegensis TaxID=43959 RepID=A0AAV5QET7_9ASCO|nr:mRNA-binding ribosome biosynthesis protein [Saccharomycopsis crataegensis]
MSNPRNKHRNNNNEQGLDKKTLFVRSIPFDATSEELSDFFSQFAPIRHGVIVTDNENNSRGFGFVSFALEEDAQLALEKGRKEKFKGRVLRVDVAKRRERNTKKDPSLDDDEEEEQGNKPAPVTDYNDKEAFFKNEIEDKKRSRLIIRNLPWSIRNPEELTKHFQRYGTVQESIIPRKKDGKMCGFAFVQMKKFSGAKLAVEKSKSLKLKGREVQVEFSIEKSKWETIQERSGKKSTRERVEGEDDEENEDEEEKDEEKDDSDSDSESGSDDDDDDDDDDDEDKEEEPARPRPNKQEPYTIFIRNLPYDATKEGLTSHFGQFGPIKYALPVIDKETGLARGTGFVAFTTKEGYETCLENAPDMSHSSASLLLSDDVPAAYVYDGRILSITSAVNRERAGVLKDKNSERRAQLLGKQVGNQDKRNLFLLNEGRISPTSKIAELLTKTDLEIREKSYKVRIDQLNKNPSLHLSLTRLAIRNLPRVLTEKSLKALGRKAVVEFAKEVKTGNRQSLSKEELQRSTKHKESNSLEDPNSKKSKKKGVVRQAKVLVEVSASGEAGRSKGYGFLEFKDHRNALMALRYLNCHEITREEVMEGLTDEEKKFLKYEGGNKRRLIVEFAIEHANVVNRRKEKVQTARQLSEIKKTGKEEEEKEEKKEEKKNKKKDAKKRTHEEEEKDKTQDIIKNKRRKKNAQKKMKKN